MSEKPKKPTLFNSANEVEKMMFAIDNHEGHLDEQIVEDFNTIRETATDAVNRCLYRFASLDMYIATAQQEVIEAKSRLAKLEKAKEHLERYVLACVKSVTYPLKSELGEFSEKLSAGRVEFTVPVKAAQSFTNVLSHTSPDFGINQRFLERIEFYRIRKDEVNAALKDGEKLPFAKLVKDSSLCIKKLKSLLA